MSYNKKGYHQISTVTASSSPYYSINTNYYSLSNNNNNNKSSTESRMPAISTATTNNTATTQSTKITSTTIKNHKKLKLTARLDQMFNNLLMNNDYELNRLFLKSGNFNNSSSNTTNFNNNNTDFMNDHMLNEKKINKDAFKVLFNERRYSNLYDFFNLKSINIYIFTFLIF
jgi:hypothetical protein